MKFKDPKIRSKRITVRLDTGADITCIPKHLADSLKLDINTDSANTLRLLDASGNFMLVYGSAEVFLTPTHGSLINQTKNVEMIVTDSKKKSLLLSVDELTQWRLLTDVFWAACSRVKQAAAPTDTPTSAPNPKIVPKKASTLDKLKVPFENVPDTAID